MAATKRRERAPSYLAAACLFLQVLGLAAGPFHVPDAVQRGAIVVLAVGSPGAVVVAWYHGDAGAGQPLVDLSAGFR